MQANLISPSTRKHIRDFAGDLLPAVVLFPEHHACSGFVLTQYALMHNPVVDQQVIGSVDPAKLEKCRELALEKCLRIISCRSKFSSWETRNETISRYGGGIRVDGGSMAVSGLSEWGDEAVALVLARLTDVLSPAAIDRVVGISGNPIYGRLAHLHVPVHL